MPTLKKLHAPRYDTKPQPRQGRTANDADFYNSRPWRRLSAAVAKEEPLCRECLKKELYRAGKVTDHIVPISQGGDRWERENLQRLCLQCHAAKNGRERHQTHRG